MDYLYRRRVFWLTSVTLLLGLVAGGALEWAELGPWVSVLAAVILWLAVAAAVDRL